MGCGNNYSTWNECAEKLLERFFPVSCLNVEESMEHCVNVREVQVKGFERQEVNVTVKRGKLGKAPGLDGLTSEILRVVWSTFPGCLMTLYNACLTYECFPNAWKKACVIALPKSPEKPRTVPARYRPISLLSVLGKTLERMMVARLDR